MANRIPRAELPIGTFQDTFGIGKLDSSEWRRTDHAGSTTNSNTNNLASSHVDTSQGMLGLRLTQTGSGPFVSTGAEVTSKRRFGYGTYEFTVRASSIAPVPTAGGTGVQGAVTAIFLEFNAGADGYVRIGFENEGLWQRNNAWLLTCWDSVGDTSKVSIPTESPGSGFTNLKFTWLPDQVLFYINGKIVHTATINVPSLTGQLKLQHYGTNSLEFGGEASNVDKWVYVSHVRYTPSSTNLVRNSSMEIKYQSFLRPFQWYQFLISFPDDPEPEVLTTWTAPTGRGGVGTAAGLRAEGAVPYVVGEYPRRFGIRSAPWEDEDHNTVATRTGIRAQWQIGVQYVATWYARIGAGGADWTGMDMSWSSPPNVRETLLNPPLSTSEWRRYAVTFTWSNPVEPYGNFFLNVIGDTHAGDEIWIDDVDIYPGTEVREYVREASAVAPPLVVQPPSGTSSMPLGIYVEGWSGIQLTDVPLDYSHLNLFQAEPVGLPNPTTGSFTFPYYPVFDAEDVQICRDRGQKVGVTVGGAGAHFYFQERAQSQRFAESFDEFYNTLGGLDHCDFNNFELFSAPPQWSAQLGRNYTVEEWVARGHYPAAAGSYSTNAWNAMATEMTWIAGQMKARYGSNFRITMPVAPGSGFAPADRVIALAMKNAGVLDAVYPQYYDSSDLVTPNAIKSLTDQWVDLLGEEHVGITLGANYSSGSTLAQAQAAWNLVLSAYPNNAGIMAWSAQNDSAAGYSFGSTMRPLMPTTGGGGDPGGGGSEDTYNAYRALLLNMAHTGAADQSTSEHTVTPVGSPTFDSAGGHFSGGARLSVPSDSRWELHTYATIDIAGITFNSVAGTQTLVCRRDDAVGGMNPYWSFELQNGILHFRYVDAGGTTRIHTVSDAGMTLSAGVAYDLRWERHAYGCLIWINGADWTASSADNNEPLAGSGDSLTLFARADGSAPANCVCKGVRITLDVPNEPVDWTYPFPV